MFPMVSWCSPRRESTSGCLFSRAGQFIDYFAWDFFYFFKFNRTELETLLSSPRSEDWIRISEMFLGKVRDDFKFIPKHKAHSYWYFLIFFVILKFIQTFSFSYTSASSYLARSIISVMWPGPDGDTMLISCPQSPDLSSSLTEAH